MRKRYLTRLMVLVLFTLALCSILITQLRRKEKRQKTLEDPETYMFSRRTSKWRYLFPPLLSLGLLQYFSPQSWKLHFQERNCSGTELPGPSSGAGAASPWLAGQHRVAIECVSTWQQQWCSKNFISTVPLESALP